MSNCLKFKKNKIFCSPFGILYGHVVCKHGLIMDPAKITIIVNLPPPTSSTTTSGYIGTYGVLQEIHKGVHIDHCPYGETTKER